MFQKLLFLPAFLLPYLVLANPYYSIADGNWSTADSWSLTNDGPPSFESPSSSDTVYIQHAIIHNAGKTYKHTGNVIIEAGGYLHIDTGYGSSNVYKFEGNRFEVYGTLTCTSDFFHQKSWSNDYGILILHEASGFAIGDDLILCGTSETILNTINCGDAGTLDDIYFRGTQAKMCGQGHFIIPDRMRAWNDSETEIIPASTQIVNQLCAGFKLFDDPGTCTNPVITGGGTFTLKQRDFDLVAISEPKQIRLHWQIDETDIEAAYFIERSHNGQSFSTLNQVSISEIDQTQLQGIDKQPLNGRQYYRIKQIPLDGEAIYSEVISLNYYDHSPQFQVFQNPNQPIQLQLRGIASEQSLSLKLYNANGAIVQHSHLPPSRSGTAELSLTSDLPPGIYIVELLHPSSNMLTRFVLQ
ncbi:MAG: T9SS type A sorting domain-containing protein [Bacteroidia bacterium]